MRYYANRIQNHNLSNFLLLLSRIRSRFSHIQNARRSPGAGIGVDSINGDVMQGSEIAYVCSHNARIVTGASIEAYCWFITYYSDWSIFYANWNWFTIRIGNLNYNVT